MRVAAVQALDELGHGVNLVSGDFEVADELESIVHGRHVSWRWMVVSGWWIDDSGLASLSERNLVSSNSPLSPIRGVAVHRHVGHLLVGSVRYGAK